VVEYAIGAKLKESVEEYTRIASMDAEEGMDFYRENHNRIGK
jgi:hypothetical protein